MKIELNESRPSIELSQAVQLDADLVSVPSPESPGVIVAQIIPPPVDGRLQTDDGRVQIVEDPAALAAAINAQAVVPRIDIDHESEPQSRAYRGSTQARGWVRNARVNEAGGISAELDLHPETVDLLARDRYRWLSPGLFMESDRRVAGLSSLALTNRPNLQELRVSLHDADLDTRETELDTRAAELDAREADLERQDQERVTTALDAAVEAGDITRETVEYHRAAIGTHETVDAGLAAFRAATPRLLSNADRRTAPAGAPRRQGGAAKVSVSVPVGFKPPTDARRELAGRIQAHASQRGISFREAAVVLAREEGR